MFETMKQFDLIVPFNLQVPDLSSKVLSTLAVFLGLPHVHVRKTTATKLYEALILHADACGIPENNLEEVSHSEIFIYLIVFVRFCQTWNNWKNNSNKSFFLFSKFQIMNCLLETDWGQNIAEIRQIRNNLCQLMNIKPPVTAATAK